MTSTLTVTTHTGPTSLIPSDASPGLLFLKAWLIAIDTLDPTTHPIEPLLAKRATLIMGNEPPSHAKHISPMLEVRAKHLEAFGHELLIAWDIELSGKGESIEGEETETGTDEKKEQMKKRGRRTVMFEAVPSTVFKNDPDKFEIKVKEFNIIELEESSHGDGRLLATEIRTYMDSRPVQDRAARLHSQSSYGESRSQY
ncbi:hypothetical protein PHISCL_01937 [Aspergillus sclerotialis]|uniref:Uncharacterized protein n=1 Tax=Aspergillus sclerotialis TaxID=2070753 RepID=A0A3A2ZRF8_9EURO|nr:hypothetical protein PHISCL_01937 [Aspergillus sclerotialis]